LTLAFRQPSLRDTFVRRDDFQANLREALADVLGVDLQIEAIVDPAVQAVSPALAGRDPKPDPVSSAAPSRAAGSTKSSAREQPTDDDAHPDDRDHDADRLSERELLERTLGARVIEEIEHG
jgi:DNA polymerase III subunit gamma/tau